MFISYSRDNDDHCQWVGRLVDRLDSELDLHVRLDEYDLYGGKDLPRLTISISPAFGSSLTPTIVSRTASSAVLALITQRLHRKPGVLARQLPLDLHNHLHDVAGDRRHVLLIEHDHLRTGSTDSDACHEQAITSTRPTRIGAGFGDRGECLTQAGTLIQITERTISPRSA